jgi:hypothetical protein
MQEWLCNLGPYWGSAVGAVSIVLIIAIAVGAFVGIVWLIFKIGDRWVSAGLPTIQMSYETKERITKIASWTFGIFLIIVALSLIIYGGFNMWRNSCSGLGII